MHLFEKLGFGIGKEETINWNELLGLEIQRDNIGVTLFYGDQQTRRLGVFVFHGHGDLARFGGRVLG